jgi:5-methylcytosine-specific restriction endonuclease McrA
MSGEPSKSCATCGEFKPLDSFYREKRVKDGRRGSCKACESERPRDSSKRASCNRAHYRANRDALKAKALLRYYANREAELARMREAYTFNREVRLARQREWYWANREAAIATAAAWQKANPERVRARTARRRAQRLALPHEDIESAVVFDRDGGLCGICGNPVDSNDWHLDHIVPLSRGGHHTYENVQVSHPFCNLSKGARLPDEQPKGRQKTWYPPM